MLFEKYNLMVWRGLTIFDVLKYVRICSKYLKNQGSVHVLMAFILTTGAREEIQQRSCRGRLEVAGSMGAQPKRISCVWLMMLQCDFITSYKLYYTIESDLQWVQWALDVALCRNPLIQQHRWSSAVFRWKPVGHSFILLFHFELDGTDAQHFKKTTWSWSILSKPTS